MKKAACAAWFALWLVGTPLAGAQAPSGDARIVAAREALRSGDGDALDRLAASQSPHLLERYIAYWRLHYRLDRDAPYDARDFEAFLSRYEGSVLAERLRAAWLRRLAKDENWMGFDAVWRGLEKPDDDLRCQHWLARFHLGDSRGLQEAAAQWNTLSAGAAACNRVIGILAARDGLDVDAVWARFHRQMDSRRAHGAKTTLGWLPPAQMADPARLAALLKDPDAFLDKLPAGFERNRSERELMLAALNRLGRSDPKLAYMRFVRLSDKLPPETRRAAYVILGWRGAQDHLPQSRDWFRAAGDAPMRADARAWRVRAALRVADWHGVRAAVMALPESERAAPQWVYWLARAEQAGGDDAAARALYATIAERPDFYGMLAAEELGRQFSLPPPGAPLSAASLRRAESDPDLRRALALYRLDLRTEAVREWNWRLRTADDDFKLAAARVALEHNIYDRAINTAEWVDRGGHYDLRFITPYRELIEPQVRAQGLDLSWVYGLMRQESRFVSHAASSAGAQGLMQVMPATGRWVARKIGMAGYRRSHLQDPQTNVLLGTSYMRIVLDDLDDHPVLAAAGYNAGPGRAKRWRDGRTLEGAVYAETIPFDETREYVKKVMANAVIYAALMEGRPQSLKARLRQVDPG